MFFSDQSKEVSHDRERRRKLHIAAYKLQKTDCIIRVWVRDGASGRSAAVFTHFAMLKRVKFTPILPLSLSPATLSRLLAEIVLFRTFLGILDC